DDENEENIQLNEKQRHDVNLILQKRYGMLQWEQGSGKTLAAIATGTYRMLYQGIHSTWVVSSAISIRNNWDVVLKNYGLPYVFVQRIADLEKVRRGDFVILTLNKLGQLQRQVKEWVIRHNQKIMLVLDESDEISNPSTVRAKASLNCFRRCKSKLLTTGTSTRNNISEFAPQLELLYNNSINMISWCQEVFGYEKDPDDGTQTLYSDSNDYYGQPIPAYKRGYALFTASHLPERTTVFGIGDRTQDIFNADELSEILGKTVITRTFEEITGKEIRRIHQVPLEFSPEERDAYDLVMKEFQQIQRNYFGSTGDSRKDAMLRLMQQITLMLRVSSAPSTLREYTGDTPVKVMAAVDMASQWENEYVVIGVRHKSVLDVYADAIREYLPDRPLFVVTGQTTTFTQRRKLRKTFRESGNGILVCTQQSLPSSVNFEYVNKVIIPELHYNNASMSQFYMRFVRYNSTEYKDIYFLTYLGSLESNLMQMVMMKERINLFMKGQDTDLDEIYEKFGVDYNLLSMLMTREVDDEGKFQIHWGEQKIA
ncbi:MAG: N-6 DNA methylase, partial [Oscillospiraceae bacterium]|nr:N-6 DNA methylase [Oscillospiraceae bacterium]